VDTDHCRGSNRLLLDGATPVLDADGLLSLVLPNRMQGAPRVALGTSLGVEPKRVLEQLRDGARDPDQLSRALRIPAARLAAILLELELGGLIVRNGSLIARRGDVG
jgi:DNA processing protein